MLFDLVTARLIERKILLPGVTVLTRLVAQVRERATTRLWQTARLEALLVTTEGDYFSPLDRLRRAPTRISSPALLEALELGLVVVQRTGERLPPYATAT